jgi:Family of unknown function (DUF6159)
MFERMANGWELAKESWGVLKQDKELIVFPILSGIACLLVVASFLVPLWAADELQNLDDAPNRLQQPIAWAITFAFYFVNYFVITFFNSALIACAVIRFRGGDPTLADGFRASMNRLPQIAGWALVSATVGVILKAIERRSSHVGRIVIALVGTAWSIATFVVVPVLVVEGTGPIKAVQRSVSILRKTWGEALTANFGIGFITFVASLPAVGLIIGGGMLIASSQVLGAVLIGLGVLGLIAVSLISTTLNAVVLAAIYLYAADEQVPSGFDRKLLRSAFGHR